MINQVNVFLKFKLVYIIVAISFICSCTDLNETLNSDIAGNEFFQTEQEFVSAMGDIYDPLAGNYGGTRRSFFMLNEVTSDEVVVPTWADGGWEDGGVFIRMHRHTVEPTDPAVQLAWVDLFSGVNNSNRLLFEINGLLEEGNIDENIAITFLSELRAMRAFYYYLLLDNFGNVPIITGFVDSEENPSQPNSNFEAGRMAVFDFVESELLTVIENLDESITTTYGRMNKWSAHMTLAKLYLNAEVYTGTSRWEDVITHTNAIIDSDNFTLALEYSENFVASNSDSPEMIFAIPYHENFLSGFSYHFMNFHYAFIPVLQLRTNIVNGMRVMEELYMSYVDSDQNPGPQGTVIGRDGTETTGTIDARTLNNFYVGFQYDNQGNPLLDDASRPDIDPDGQHINHRPQLFSLTRETLDGGARNKKWEVRSGSSGNLNNHYAIFRYTDVLLMKAEALWRLNNNDTDALGLVNLVRNRAGVYDLASLTADNLLAERGREMFFEMTRRQDLIRFEGSIGATRFNDPWWEKDATDEFRNVFPLPRTQLQSNSNLVQNPGY